jgi:hypothetical protein
MKDDTQMPKIRTHRHRPIASRIAPYTGPVAWPETPVAHGNVCEVSTCRCGAERRTNHNAGQVEAGRWHLVEAN